MSHSKNSNHLNRNNYQFPLRSHNHFKLLVDGEAFFPAILDDLNSAKDFIYLEMYLMSSGKIANQFIEAFALAVARGVKVYVLLDHYGSKDFSKSDVNRLKKSGVCIAWYNPASLFRFRRSLHRTHRKIIVIDNNSAWTGGTGITDNFAFSEHSDKYWHETMVRIQGECVLDWRRLFELEWINWSKETLPEVDPEWDKGESFELPGRVVSNRATYKSEVRRSLINNVHRASKRVWIATAYFVPARKIRRLLIKAARRGVDVRIMLPGKVTDIKGVRYMARRYYASLLKNGVRIYEYQNRFLHLKYTVIDHWVSSGSSNMDRWNLIWNLDANQEMSDTNLAAMYEKLFLYDIKDSKCFTYDSWKKRSLWSRLWESFWGRVAGFLLWFSRREATRQHR